MSVSGHQEEGNTAALEGTETTPNVGEERTLTERELQTEPAREAR